MKFFKLLAAALCFLFLAACSGSSAYNAEECKQLAEMASNKESFTEKDYGRMIDQFGAITKTMTDAYDKYGDEAYMDSLSATPEGKEMLTYFVGFGMYLNDHTDDMSNSQKLNYAKIAKGLEKITK